MPEYVRVIIAIAIVAGGGVLLFRRIDVRLVLALCAAALFILAGHFTGFVEKFAEDMANARTVVPICCAMGFAYTLKMTECDRHLVLLLLKPVRSARWLLIPGGVIAAFIVNCSIVSQTSTAAVVGPVLIPLLLTAGFSRTTAGATLLLGASMGGEVFNPGAVEVTTLGKHLAMTGNQIVGHIAPFNLVGSGIALLWFWRLSVRSESRRALDLVSGRNASADDPAVSTGMSKLADYFTPREELAAASDAGSSVSQPTGILEYGRSDSPRIDPLKASVPLLPVVLLLIQPLVRQYLPVMRPEALIAAAMLTGVIAAGLTSPHQLKRLAESFFEGAGFAYAHVISLIVVASTFAEGFAANGFITSLANVVCHHPKLAMLSSVCVPWILASVTGTGVAIAKAYLDTVIPVLHQNGLPALKLGSMAAVTAQFGRTMSPVAPVVLMCAAMAGADTWKVLKRIAIPLLLGGAGILIAGMFGGRFFQ